MNVFYLNFSFAERQTCDFSLIWQRRRWEKYCKHTDCFVSTALWLQGINGKSSVLISHYKTYYNFIAGWLTGYWFVWTQHSKDSRLREKHSVSVSSRVNQSLVVIKMNFAFVNVLLFKGGCQFILVPSKPLLSCLLDSFWPIVMTL